MAAAPRGTGGSHHLP